MLPSRAGGIELKYRTIPNSDIDVSVIALGCWAFAGDRNWGDQDDRDSIGAVERALDRGITLFDTAVAYGDGYSEEILGRALAGRRGDAVIATKPPASEATADELERSCDGSLKRLRTDYIDLYQQHWPKHDAPFEETVAGMERLQEKGKIRRWGVCNYGGGDLGDLLECGTPATNQLCYSLLWRAIEYEVVPKCVEAQIGVLCYSPIAQGLLTGKFRSADDVPAGRARTKYFASSRPEARQREAGAEAETFRAIDAVRDLAKDHGRSMAHLAIGWLLAQPGVTSVLTGARRAKQVDENAAAGDVDLPRELLDMLTAETDELKQKLGGDADPWAYRMR